MKKIYVIIFVFAVVVVGLLAWKYSLEPKYAITIANFEDCAKIYPVMESYPAQCRTPDGRLFIQVISDETASPPVQLETIINFEQCAKAGYPVTMSYPRQCRSLEGKIFTEFTQ